MIMAMMAAGRAEAGVALGATRVIYPAGQKQVQLAVTNNDENSTYLIQSWVEKCRWCKGWSFYRDTTSVCDEGKKKRIPCVFLMPQITNCHRIGKVYSG